MRDSIRKPRVFLSHSKKDVEFIRKLEADLRRCQCDPWIDEIEIRHGKPWMDEIFATGLPSCEVAICYITEHSINSDMVRREIDARLIDRLQERSTSLFLYISSDNLRNSLRQDLQTLQIPVFNSDNYSNFLPILVSQIWRAHTEWIIVQAVQSEKVKRLEAEIRVKELESSIESGIFSSAEIVEFESIWTWMQTQYPITLTVIDSRTRAVIRNLTGKLFFSALYLEHIATQKFSIPAAVIHDAVLLELVDKPDMVELQQSISFDDPVDIEAEFLKFGFLRREKHPIDSKNIARYLFSHRYSLVLTEKFDRFNFWLEQQPDQQRQTGPVFTLTTPEMTDKM